MPIELVAALITLLKYCVVHENCVTCKIRAFCGK